MDDSVVSGSFDGSAKHALVFILVKLEELQLLPVGPVVVPEKSSSREFHGFSGVVEDSAGVDDVVVAFVEEDFVGVQSTLPEEVGAVVKLIVRKLREVGGVHDR
jgi:hypothetical protein